MVKVLMLGTQTIWLLVFRWSLILNTNFYATDWRWCNVAIDGSLDIYNHQFNKNYVQSYILLQSADAKRKFYKL